MLTKEELDAIRERWKPGTLLPPQSVLEFLGHAGHDINKLLAHIEELEKENRILTVKTKNILANNLCPDHRDKIHGKRCLMCTIEELHDILSVRWFMQDPM